MSNRHIISADDHMDMSVLPPNLWQERLPNSLRNDGLKVKTFEDGDYWTAEGRRLGPSGLTNVHGNALKRAGIPDDGFRPSNPKLRQADMDMDGVDAHSERRTQGCMLSSV